MIPAGEASVRDPVVASVQVAFELDNLDDDVKRCRAGPHQYRHAPRPLGYYQFHPATKEFRVNNSTDIICRDYVEWALSPEYIRMKRTDYELDKAQQSLIETGSEILYPKTSKRGNDVYSRRLHARVGKINRAIRGAVINKAARGEHTVRYTKALLITLTFDSDMSRYDSWYSLKTYPHDVNDYQRFKARFRKAFGNAKFIKANEARGDGYPAPHVLVLLDEWVPMYRHVGKGGQVSWRLLKKADKDQIASYWPNGFVDVEGVYQSPDNWRKWSVNKQRNPLEYITKYMSKNLDLMIPEGADVKNIGSWFGPWFEDLDKHQRVALYTLAMSWLFRLQALPVSKAILEALDSLRLDNREAVCKVETQLQLDNGQIPLVKYEFLGVVHGDKCLHCFIGGLGPPPPECIECVAKTRGCRSESRRTKIPFERFVHHG
jgi:hypothetical protein